MTSRNQDSGSLIMSLPSVGTIGPSLRSKQEAPAERYGCGLHLHPTRLEVRAKPIPEPRELRVGWRTTGAGFGGSERFRQTRNSLASEFRSRALRLRGPIS